MTFKHECSEDNTYAFAQIGNFWRSQSVQEIAAFCQATRYRVEILSSSDFRLIKE